MQNEEAAEQTDERHNGQRDPDGRFPIHVSLLCAGRQNPGWSFWQRFI
jgi:hypothetical protein